MPFEGLSLDDLTEQHLQSLKENGVAEGKTLDYKRDLPGKSDADKKEFLADVSSFANASGGHLVFGVEEDGGVPVELCGVDVDDMDKEIQRQENLIRDGLEPRIYSYSFKPIDLANGRKALLIRIPKSFASPHVVKLGKSFRFYSRNSVGKYPLDVQELRNAFLLSAMVAERIRNFRQERIGKVIAGELPVPLFSLPGGLCFVLHLVPFEPVGSGGVLPERLKKASTFAPHMWSTSTPPEGRYNFEGYLCFKRGPAGMEQPEFLPLSHIQFFRDGTLEAVAVDWGPEAQRSNTILVKPGGFEKEVVDVLSGYLPTQRWMGVEPPVAVMLSLVGTEGYRLSYTEPNPGYVPPGVERRIDRDVLLLPEVIVEDFDADAHEYMRPVFDAVWNAAGWPSATSRVQMDVMGVTACFPNGPLP